MKIVIGYPPLKSKKGVPQLSQNRQFQWTAGGLVSYAIYPVVLAYAGTLLKKAGHQVFWLDGIASHWSYQRWFDELKKIKPDLLIMETKTPVVKQHWGIINKLKIKSASWRTKLKIILVGDHVTALPAESFANSQVDYILTGGDYDWLLLNLVNHLEKNEKLESGKFKLNHDLNKLPLIDRDLTQWRLYAFRNSNFYQPPGAYTMFSRDCWWGKCRFCSWASNLYPVGSCRTMAVKKALDEVGSLIKNCQVREIMDDSGTFPTGDWLREFCQGMIQRGYHRKIRFNCNMRFNSDLTEADYQLMARAGFRFLLYGLESANQDTLDRLNKNLALPQVEKVLTWATKAGLWPHLTVMVGYPWEGRKEIQQTVNLVRSLFQQGLARSMQATLVMPYPGTPFFQEAKKKSWLRTLNWNRYDMSEPILKTKVSSAELMATIRRLYQVSILNQAFLRQTLQHLSHWEGVKYVSLQGAKFFAKMGQYR